MASKVESTGLTTRPTWKIQVSEGVGASSRPAGGGQLGAPELAKAVTEARPKRNATRNGFWRGLGALRTPIWNVFVEGSA